MPELKLFFLQMAAILTAARLVAGAFRFIGQPAVIGAMAAGILLGPSLLGRIFPAIMNDLFPTGGLGALYALSQLGLVLFPVWAAPLRGCRSYCFWERRRALPHSRYWRAFWPIAN